MAHDSRDWYWYKAGCANTLQRTVRTTLAETQRVQHCGFCSATRGLCTGTAQATTSCGFSAIILAAGVVLWDVGPSLGGARTRSSDLCRGRPASQPSAT